MGIRLLMCTALGMLLAAGAWAADGGAAPPVTPLQAEMRELTAAMQVILVAIANNELDAVTPAIHKVHDARTNTEHALERHEVVLPRNGDKLADFIKQDEAFHGELVKLVKAARSHDLPTATAQVGVILNGCTACHVKYRFQEPKKAP